MADHQVELPNVVTVTIDDQKSQAPPSPLEVPQVDRDTTNVSAPVPISIPAQHVAEAASTSIHLDGPEREERDTTTIYIPASAPVSIPVQVHVRVPPAAESAYTHPRGRRTSAIYAKLHARDAITIDMHDRGGLVCQPRQVDPLIDWSPDSMLGRVLRSPRLSLWVSAYILVTLILVVSVSIVDFERGSGPLLYTVLSLGYSANIALGALAGAGFADRHLLSRLCRRFDFLVVVVSSLVFLSCGQLIFFHNILDTTYASATAAVVIASGVLIALFSTLGLTSVMIMADAMPTLSSRVKTIVLYSYLVVTGGIMTGLCFFNSYDDIALCLDYGGTSNCHSVVGLERSALGQLILFMCRKLRFG